MIALEADSALEAIDDALRARSITPMSHADTYDFSHALIRETLYAALNPSRRIRLHRDLAEAMERSFGDHAAEHAAEIAHQYWLSRELPGAERGAEHAIVGADRAAAAHVHHSVAAYLRIALDLLPPDDGRRPRLLTRHALALMYSLDFDVALETAREAARQVAATEGANAAAEFISSVAMQMSWAGQIRGAWELSTEGLPYAGERRDLAWAILHWFDLMRREAEDPDDPGILLDCPERLDVLRILANHNPLHDVDRRPPSLAPVTVPATSRQELLARAGGNPVVTAMLGGDLRGGLKQWNELSVRAAREGQIAIAAFCHAFLARVHIALGNFAEASASYERGTSLGRRLVRPSVQLGELAAAADERRRALDADWKESFSAFRGSGMDASVYYWASASIRIAGALVFARMGRGDHALDLLATSMAAIERGPGWAPNLSGTRV